MKLKSPNKSNLNQHLMKPIVFKRRAQSALRPRDKVIVYSQKTGRQIHRQRPTQQTLQTKLTQGDIIDRKLSKLKTSKLAKPPESREVKELKRRLREVKLK